MKEQSFHPVDEKRITQSMARSFMEQLIAVSDTDAIIVGGGPSGLMAAMEIRRAGYRAVVIERNNYLGGGFWIGGYLMNKVTFRAPAQRILDELGIPYSEDSEGLYLADGPHACSRLIAAACDAGVTFLTMTQVDDVIYREGPHVAGVVVNWMPVSRLPRQISCVDPIGLQGRIVVDATGHEAVVVRCLEKQGWIEAKGESAMWVENSEDAVVEATCEVFPGLIITGMAVAATHGLPRMGPTFGGMLQSGRRAGEIASRILGSDSRARAV